MQGMDERIRAQCFPCSAQPPWFRMGAEESSTRYGYNISRNLLEKVPSRNRTGRTFRLYINQLN